MKNTVSLILASLMLLALCACGAAPAAAPAAPATASPAPETAAPAEEKKEEEPLVGMPNPMTELTEQELTEKTGLSFRVPEGASDVHYFTITGEPATAQMSFNLGESKIVCRAQPLAMLENNEIPDISGMYYTWKTEQEGSVNNCRAVYKLNPDEQGWVGWFDVVPGVLYNVSMDKGASVEKLTEIAEASCPPLQGDAVPDEELFFAFYGSDPEPHALPVTVDIDGDGRTETVDIRMNPNAAQDSGVFGLYIHCYDGSEFFEPTYIIGNPHVRIADIDSDGCREVFLCGDCGSDDYVSYCRRLKAGRLDRVKFSGDYRNGWDGSPTDFADGSITGISDDMRITMESITHMLGSYNSTIVCAMKEDGTIAPADGAYHEFYLDFANGVWLTTNVELTGYATDGRNKAIVLPAKSEIYLLGTNGLDEVYFLARNSGEEGALPVQRDDRTGKYYVCGVLEDNAFEFLPYAG